MTAARTPAQCFGLAPGEYAAVRRAARAMARAMARRVRNPLVTAAEVETAAISELARAPRYDGSTAPTTWAHPYLRRGAVGALRDYDALPRGARRRAAAIQAWADAFETAHGRRPTSEEAVGAFMPATRSATHRTRSRRDLAALVHHAEAFRLPGSHADGWTDPRDRDGAPPDGAVERESDAAMVPRLLALLAPRERAIVRAYFLDGLTMRAIGADHGLTEARVCQLVKGSLAAMRAAAHRAGYGAPLPLAA